ncbi:putative double-stranded RNA/RNA-DNA hybrid binding protein [Ceratocystis lukuohia]|uniref:Double-stranded RNA/RNA-DNA hybrid binding protein n=1 Tax=Ceratocystis lukuohia TaxID=2019550 RepID=A0ABR4M8Q6_9PEZI
MGVIATGMVVTSTERHGKAKLVQPGNREWVTVIEAIHAEGWVNANRLANGLSGTGLRLEQSALCSERLIWARDDEIGSGEAEHLAEEVPPSSSPQVPHILRGPNFNPVLRKLLPSQMEKHTRLRPLLEGPDMPPQTWLSKEEETKRHQSEVENTLPGTLVAYSGGSKDASGNAGAGWAIIEDGATQEVNHIALGKWMEVADEQAVGALEATKRATSHEGAGEIWLTSQEAVDETRRILKAWADKTPGRLARVLWVPGHMGIRGNELADTQAKLGSQGLVTEHRFSLAGERRWRRDQLRLDYEGWRKEQKGYSPLGTGVPTEPPFRNSRYKGLTRIELGHILAARTGDGDCDKYHERWGHNCPLGCRACSQAKERGHWWTCKALPRPWSQRFADKLLKNTKATCCVANVLRRNLRLFQETQQPEPELSCLDTTEATPSQETRRGSKGKNEEGDEEGEVEGEWKGKREEMGGGKVCRTGRRCRGGLHEKVRRELYCQPPA